MARRRNVLQSGGAVSFYLEGGAELVDTLKALGKDVESVLEEAALAGGEKIKDRANELAPGPNIDQEVTDKKAGLVEVTIGPLKKFFYYLYAETGTVAHEVAAVAKEALLMYGVGADALAEHVSVGGTQARPFMRPAADEAGDDAVTAFGQVIDREIMRHVESP